MPHSESFSSPDFALINDDHIRAFHYYLLSLSLSLSLHMYEQGAFKMEPLMELGL